MRAPADGGQNWPGYRGAAAGKIAPLQDADFCQIAGGELAADRVGNVLLGEASKGKMRAWPDLQIWKGIGL